MKIPHRIIAAIIINKAYGNTDMDSLDKAIAASRTTLIAKQPNIGKQTICDFNLWIDYNNLRSIES